MTVTPRHDEKNAIEAVLKSLKINGNPDLPQVVYEPNGVKKAPDYLLSFTTHSVMVEIRNSGDGFLVLPESKDLLRREKYERSAANMVDKIKERVKKWLEPTKKIILTITSPIPLEHRGSLAKMIAKQIQNAYHNQRLCFDQKINLEIDTGDNTLPLIYITVTLINYYTEEDHSSVNEILGSSLQSTNPVLQADLSKQAEYTLSTALLEKKKKLERLEGEKWLVLINNNPLLNEMLYSEAYTEILESSPDLKNIFSKIFLVEGAIAKELEAKPI